MELETVFYVIGIIFMTVMLVLVIALVTAVFVIRAKIVAMHDKIEQKLSLLGDITNVGKKIVNGARAATGR